MRSRSSTWEWDAFADAMRYARLRLVGSEAALRRYASIIRPLALPRRMPHLSIAKAHRSVTLHGASGQRVPQRVGRERFRSAHLTQQK